MPKIKQRIALINDLIIELASGNFDINTSISEQEDDLDAIISSINMLGEELKYSTVSKDYFESIVRGIADLLIVTDEQDKIKFANQQVFEKLGYKEKEIIGNPSEKIFHQYENYSFEEIKSQLEHIGYCYNIETSMVTKLGTNIPASLSVSLIYDKSEHPIGKVYIAKDISLLKKAQKELEEKNRDLDTFVYKTSHDLRGPVASILALIKSAKLSTKDKESQIYFEMIEQCASKLDETLINLIEFSTITARTNKRKPVNFEKLIEDTLTELKDTEGFNSMVIYKNIDIQHPFSANKILLRTLFIHLMENAIKYQKRNLHTSWLKIGVEEKIDHLSITFEDNGTGILPKHQEKIFDMFYRGDNSVFGAGLGLYLVKNIVQKLKGYIGFESSPNKGSTFKITLPFSSINK